MVKSNPLSKSLPLTSIILPYYGFVDECCFLMQSLSRGSQKLWNENEQILLRIVAKKRTITLHVCNDNVIQLINLNSLKYFNIDVEDTENFIRLLRNRLQSQTSEIQEIGKKNLLLFEKESKSTTELEHRSTCSNFMNLKDISLNINNLEEISKHISLYEDLKTEEMIESISQKSNAVSNINEISYMEDFTLMNNTDLAQFYNHEKRTKMLEFAYDIEKTTDELKNPYINHIGNLKVNVECDKFLKQFLNVCDTTIDSIEFSNFLRIEGDIFAKEGDLSRTLKSSVKSIKTNKSFENTCHRFSNVESIQVQNFPAVNFLLSSRIQTLKNIELSNETFSSVITIKNSFIVANDKDCEPLYCENLIAHFSSEDVTISDDLKYLYIGGNMMSLKGISFSKVPENLRELINQGKDESKDVGRIIVLLENDSNYSIVSESRKQFAYQRQMIRINTNSKLVDLKIKKVNIQLEMNSNSDLLLKKNPSNEMFLQGLKLLINGKGNLSSQKLAFTIKNQMMQSLIFEVQKYEDGIKLLDQLSPLFPSVIQTLGITISQGNGETTGDVENQKHIIYQKLKTIMKNFPKMETILKDLNCENSIRLYYSQIMNNCFQVERSS